MAGHSYYVTFTIVDISQGTFIPRFTGGGTTLGKSRSSPGTYTEILTPTEDRTSFSILSAGGGAAGSIDNVLVKETTDGTAINFVESGWISPGELFNE